MRLSDKPSSYEFRYIVRDYRVIDGDTIWMQIDLGFNTYIEQSCRLLGVDTPEHNTEAGKAVKYVVERWCQEWAPLAVVSHKLDKFAGRFDGIIYDHDCEATLNDYLHAMELAREYTGGAKIPWGQTELSAIYQRATNILAGRTPH